MNFGLPVIAFDVPDGPKYLIENNENGFLIQPFNLEYFSDKLIELMNDKQLRQNFGQKSYEKSLNFDLNKIHEKWLEIYKS
jgi:glycosyltransferase involved in cell wall biosynthesis